MIVEKERQKLEALAEYLADLFALPYTISYKLARKVVIIKDD